MTAKHVKGMATIATLSIAFASVSLTGWMGWSSLKTIEYGERLVSLEASAGDIPEIKRDAKNASVQAAVAAEIMKLAAPNLGVNPAIAEKNVFNHIASTTNDTTK